MQAQAAGLAEGFITAEQISMDWQNTVGVYCDDGSEFCDKLHKFLSDLFDWIQSQINENPTDSYWYQVSLLFLNLKLINYKVALYVIIYRLMKANFAAEQRSIHIHQEQLKAGFLFMFFLLCKRSSRNLSNIK